MLNEGPPRADVRSAPYVIDMRRPDTRVDITGRRLVERKDIGSA